MIEWSDTLGRLRERLDRWIALLGPDAPVGCEFEAREGGLFMDDVQMELVFVNKDTRQVVGEEADDYEPKDGECEAVKFS